MSDKKAKFEFSPRTQRRLAVANIVGGALFSMIGVATGVEAVKDYNAETGLRAAAEAYDHAGEAARAGELRMTVEGVADDRERLTWLTASNLALGTSNIVIGAANLSGVRKREELAEDPSGATGANSEAS